MIKINMSRRRNKEENKQGTKEGMKDVVIYDKIKINILRNY
jgi:hypothetical protein